MAAVIAIVIIVLLIAGQWKLFVKAGEPGWASIIPFYSTYIMYKICWNPKFFWLFLLCGVFSGMNAADSMLASVIGGIFSLALLVLNAICMYQLAKAFGKGVGYTLGLIFLQPIFLTILGFDDSDYDSSYSIA